MKKVITILGWILVIVSVISLGRIAFNWVKDKMAS